MIPMRSVVMVNRDLFCRAETILFFHSADADGIAFVPPLLSGPLGEAVFGVLAPALDRFGAIPVGNGDADAFGVAGTFDAEKARHGGGEFNHAIGGAVVTVGIGGGPARGEDDRVVRRLRRTCVRVHAGSVMRSRLAIT